MSDAVQQELRGFVAELIEQSGGLFDWPADSDRGQAILTPELAQLQGVAEMLPLSTRPDDEGILISLASDFLNAAEHWLDAVPRIRRLQLAEAYLKRGDLGEAVNRAFTWLNAKVGLIDSRPTRIEYHTGGSTSYWLRRIVGSRGWRSRSTLQRPWKSNSPTRSSCGSSRPMRASRTGRTPLPATTRRPLQPSDVSNPWQPPLGPHGRPARTGSQALNRLLPRPGARGQTKTPAGSQCGRARERPTTQTAR